MNTQTFDKILDAIQSVLMSILTKIGPFFVALMPALFTAYAIYRTFKAEAGAELALTFALVVGLAMETVGIVATHTSVDLYNAKEVGIIQPVKFWLMAGLVPVYVLGVSGVVYFSQDAFTPLVRGLGVASPFLTCIVYVAVALMRDIRRIESQQETLQDKQSEIEHEKMEWEHEKERLILEQKHQERLSKIESKRSSNRPIDRLTQTLDRSIEYSNLDDKPSNTRNLDELNARRLADKDASLDAVLSFLDANPHASLNDIGRSIGRSKSTAGNYVDELQQAGKLHKNGNGWEVSK